MEIQPQLVLLQKTLLNIEGMGREIYPDLDLWETAAPFMEKWMRGRTSISNLLRQITKSAPGWIEQLPEIPQLAIDTIYEFRSLGRNNAEQSRLLRELNTELASQRKQRAYNRIGGLALVIALIGSFLPMAGLASQQEVMVGTSLLGGLGIYWMFIRP